MDIRFVSTLTTEDGNALAPAILAALGAAGTFERSESR
jgi:hypothetical protein